MKHLDHGLPLDHLKGYRRELVEKLGKSANPPTDADLVQVAAVQGAIAAVEAVIAENEAETLKGAALLSYYEAKTRE